MVEKRSFIDWVLTVLNYVLVTMLALICLYPLVYVVAASFSDPRLLLEHRGLLVWPTGFSLRGYQTVLRNPNIMQSYLNTFYIVVMGTAINMIMTIFASYVLAKKGYPLRRFFVFMCVFTMYFGGGLIPNFLVVKNLGLYNTHWALMLPGAIATWNMIVMRTAFMGVPEALQESAYLDGANDFTILFRIYLPVCKATMAVMILFYAVGHWNAWFNALIYLRDSDKYPLQLVLREILINNGSAGVVDDADAQYMKELIKYATIVVATVPILCIYPFAQKFFMKGVMMGSVKG